MTRFLALLAPVALVIGLLAPTAAGADRVDSGDSYAVIAAGQITLGNDLVERTWSRDAFGTVALVDKRAEALAGSEGPDFHLFLSRAEIPSTLFKVGSARAQAITGGVRLTMELESPLAAATRVVEVYDGIAGFRTQMTLRPTTPLALRGATLDEAHLAGDTQTTIHAFRAGADWREPGWDGPPLSIGDDHSGTWRDSRTGSQIEGPAQWASTSSGSNSLFMVMERSDWPSSRAGHTAGTTRLVLDYSRDVVSAGPFEEELHAENPTPGDGRVRVLEPGTPFAFEAAFTGFGSDRDDEPWQFYKYLVRRMPPYARDVTFNSNGTDANVISTGAKDDMDFATVQQVAPKANRLGIETFILDDGWQANSGDWEPDCPEHRDWRLRYPPRFPDCNFQAVREAIAPMKLGLWMSPMHFNPGSDTYQAHPEWACHPVGDALAVFNRLDPNGGSNDAGLGTWSTAAIPHVEARIRHAIEQWGVTYFKFDFLVWLDCAGEGDMYDYQDAFVAMVDRLITKHPNVTFQIDETNDYRLFPFLSVARGPSWFQNGSPPPNRLLHNLWNLSPFVPSYSLGQHFLGGMNRPFTDAEVDLRMATALASHMTFFSDLRDYPDAMLDRARPWIDFYKGNRDALAQFTYPLLDDPIEGGWTALQPWNPETGVGALLAFRQGSEEVSKTIALRNVPAGMTFDLIEAPSGVSLGRATSAELSAGLPIEIPEKQGARVIVIRPVDVTTTTLTYDGDTSGSLGSMATLAATLTGDGAPIEGVPVTFHFREETFIATTDAAGRATVALRLIGQPETFEVTADFAGSDLYLPSRDSQLFQVTARRG